MAMSYVSLPEATVGDFTGINHLKGWKIFGELDEKDEK